jgi:UDPglucose 6-dehydrogenase
MPLLDDRFSLVYNPAFTAAGTAMRDFLSPEFVLLGSDDHEGRASADLRRFYATIHDRPVFCTDIPTAELTKVAYNTFIGQKIAFANAMMELSHRVGANVDDLSDVLALARTRIVSPLYLRGGMGDGGACHPRDNIALSWLAREVGLSHDLFTDVMQARDDQTAWLAELIDERSRGRPVVLLGKAYKPESDLTSGSPALLLAAMLEQRGIAFTHLDHRVDGGRLELGIDAAALFFVATKHAEYAEASFPTGSTVLDPWGYVPVQEGVEVVRLGRR